MKTPILILISIINLLLFPGLGFFGLLGLVIIEIMIWGAIDCGNSKAKVLSEMSKRQVQSEVDILSLRDVSPSSRVR